MINNIKKNIKFAFKKSFLAIEINENYLNNKSY